MMSLYGRPTAAQQRTPLVYEHLRRTGGRDARILLLRSSPDDVCEGAECRIVYNCSSPEYANGAARNAFSEAVLDASSSEQSADEALAKWEDAGIKEYFRLLIEGQNGIASEYRLPDDFPSRLDEACDTRYSDVVEKLRMRNACDARQYAEDESTMTRLISNLEELHVSSEKSSESDEELRKKLSVPRPAPLSLVPLRIGRSSKCWNMTNSEFSEAKRVLEYGDNRELLIEKFNIPITRSVLRCLSPPNWLNDEVINFYLSILESRNQKQLAAEEDVCKCFFFNTFFYAKLSGDGANNYCYDSVRRWTKRKKVDIFSKDLIFIPLHIQSTHWTLCVVDMRKDCESIRFFDSMNGRHTALGPRIRRYLQDEHLDKRGMPLLGVERWHFLGGHSERDTPQQHNCYDCGVFLCRMAESISDGRSFDFSQEDIRAIRMKMVLQIIAGEIHG